MKLLGLVGFAALLALLFFYGWLVFSLPRLIAHDPRCDGPERYEAMREAYEAGRPQPC